MIVDERLVTYINSLDRGNTPVLDEIEKEALRAFVPIIRKEMQSSFPTRRSSDLCFLQCKNQCVFSRWEQRLVFLPF